MEQVGIDVIEERERELIGRALPRLAAIDGVRLLGNVDAPRLAVASFLVASGGKQLHAKFVVRLLSDLFGIQGRAGCSCAGPYGHSLLNIDEETSSCFLEAIEAGYEGVKPGWTRLSFHYLIDDDEMGFLIDAVAFVAREGFRFLPLYSFDWRTGAWRHKVASAHHAHETGASSHHAFDPSAWRAVKRSTSPRREDYAEYLAAAERSALELASASPADADAVAARAEATDDQAPTGLDERVLWFAR
jgi:hypothetical protein